MTIHSLSASYPLVARRPSVNSSVVCDHFGVSAEAERVVVAEKVEVDVRPGDVVLFVGPSGSGKSTLLRALAAQLCEAHRVIDSGAIDLGDHALVDELPIRVDEGLDLLAACGLGEARLMLRSAAELSEGQRYRFRLARAVSEADGNGWVVADEFTATLDRVLAKVVAFGVRRLADRQGCGFLLATTHEDVIADLAPDVIVRCRGDGEVVVVRSGAATETGETIPRSRKKKDGQSASPVNSNSRPDRDATGRTSLGGITAGRGWASCGS